MKRLFLNLIAVFLVVVAVAQEPVKPQLTPRIITATRSVSLFTGLEKQVFQAIQRKDKAALDALVEDDFEIEMPDADPLPGDDWEQAVLSRDYDLKSFLIRQMSARDLGTAVVVNYDRVQQSTYKGKSDGGEFFVVDLWNKEGDSWRLAARYVSKVSTIPWTPKTTPKPTGKQ